MKLLKCSEYIHELPMENSRKKWILKILDANMFNILQINMRDNFKSDPGFLSAQWFNKRLKYNWSHKDTDKIQRL